jgi:hypothetical protein
MKMICALLKVALMALLVAVVMATLTGFKFVEVNYTAVRGDTLQEVAERYIVKNTATIRDIKEFKEGIREENFDVIGNREITLGDVLKITWWEAD